MNPTEKTVLISLAVGLAVLGIGYIYTQKKYGALLGAASATNTGLNAVEGFFSSVETHLANLWGDITGNDINSTPSL